MKDTGADEVDAFSVSSSDDEKSSKKRKIKKSKNKKIENAKVTEEEEDAFIDEEGDDEEMVSSYKKQREYSSDEDVNPGSDSDDAVKDKPAPPVDDNEPGWKKQMNSLKPKRPKKNADNDDEKRDTVAAFLAKIYLAAKKDEKSIAKLQPAGEKLRLLPQVVNMLQNKELHAELLKSNLLDALGEWLRPHKIDKTLPSQTIRNGIIKILDQLPVAKEDLRRGGDFGRAVSYLSDCRNELEGNRKILKGLLQKWSRLIYDKQTNLDNSFAHETEVFQRPAKLNSAKKNVAQSGLKQLVKTKRNREAEKETVDPKTYRAQIPQPRNFSFTKNIGTAGSFEEAVEVGAKSESKLKRKEIERRMFSKRNKNNI